MTAIRWDSLDDYVAHLTSAAFVGFCSKHAGVPLDAVERRLRDYAGEVIVGVDLVRDDLRPGQRVLEVGAGLGLLSIWLARQGVSIVMLESGAGGFDENRRLLDAVLEYFDVRPPLLNLKAEELDPERHGRFDLIFSVNVLEHIPLLDEAIAGMAGALAPSGVMRHTCANYTVPYDPHYDILLVPCSPRLTERLLPHLAGDDVWQSLNFITCRRVARICTRLGLTCEFEKGLLAAAFDRMDRDPAFRARRGPLVRAGQRVLAAAGLLTLLRRLPPQWATPMIVSVRFAEVHGRHAAVRPLGSGT